MKPDNSRGLSACLFSAMCSACLSGSTADCAAYSNCCCCCWSCCCMWVWCCICSAVCLLCSALNKGEVGAGAFTGCLSEWLRKLTGCPGSRGGAQFCNPNTPRRAPMYLTLSILLISACTQFQLQQSLTMLQTTNHWENDNRNAINICIWTEGCISELQCKILWSTLRH